MRLKILVCGSRDWNDPGPIRERFDLVPYVLPFVPVVIHGAARGADLLAADEAEARGWLTEAFPANWEKHGKRAGVLRNLMMLDEKPHVVFAFQRNGSRGTQHTIDEARRRGIPVEVFAREVLGSSGRPPEGSG